jgi:predicted dehydrogenase
MPTTPALEMNASSRRDFLKAGAAAVTIPSVIASIAPRAHAAGSDKLKIGLVGCGGRGSGAAREALSADPNVELVAMGDAFGEPLNTSLRNLSGMEAIRSKIKVDDEHKFVGLDAYKKVIDTCDVVLLCTPPGFRPLHFKYAVEAGKHVFTEKPMATDAPGVRSIMESVELSKQKKLAICAGFCWRYDNAKRAFFEQVHNGALGDVKAAYGTYLTSPVKPMPPAASRPEGMSNLEWMVRNWYNFTWLSGDGLVEQAVHTVDWLAWCFQDQPPVSCTAVGGRQIPQEGGNIYDHIAVNYVWANDARAFLAQRQTPGCHNENNLYVLGSRGSGQLGPRGTVINGETEWKYRGPGNNMYQTEHDEFFASIRKGEPINNGDRMAKSTLMGIMGRTAAYTGKQITWEMMLNSQESIVPQITDGWKTQVELPMMAMPGITPFV